MKPTLTFLSAVLLVMFFNTSAWGGTKTSAGSGNWSTITWSPSGVPATTDDVVIAAGDSVALDNTYTVASCTVDGTGILDASTFILTVTNAFTLQSGATFKLEGTNNALPVSGTDIARQQQHSCL